MDDFTKDPAGHPSSDAGRRPRVAVLYEDGAFSPLEIAEAARGLCDVVWVVGWSVPLTSTDARLLPRLGTVLEVENGDWARVAGTLAELDADGIAVFTDRAQQPAAELAERLSLRFHSPRTALLLRDKLEQRRALQAGGLVVPAVAAVSGATVGSVAEAHALGVGWPAVLKPRRGSGGSETYLLSDASGLLAALADNPPEREFILEGFLADREPPSTLPVADMVSVELVVQDGVCRALAITGRFTLSPPLRENGAFLPANLDRADHEAVCDVAVQAADALGTRWGVLHIEVKLTPDGPRIVEVNGRVGGVVPTLLARLGGPSLITWALRLSLGLPIEPVEMPPTSGVVAFYYAWLPPVGDFTVRAVENFESILAMPEVERAWLNREVGDRTSSREGGMFGHLAAAYGSTADYEDLWRVHRALSSRLVFRLEPVAGAAPSSGPR